MTIQSPAVRAKPGALKPLKEIRTVGELFDNEEAKGRMRQIAAKHISPERMMRVLANAVRTTPKLAQCQPLTLLGSLMTCASLGIEPNTPLGHAYLIPFKTDVNLIIGYRGLIDLARRSGHITSIIADVHYSDDDHWLYQKGADPKLEHTPGPKDESASKLHAYAVAMLKGGGSQFEVLHWAQVERIRNSSNGYKTAIKYGKKDTPWIAYPDEMAKKTAIRALAKYLPLSIEFMTAVAVDGEAGGAADFATFAMEAGDGDTPKIIEATADIEDAPPAAAQAKQAPAAREGGRRLWTDYGAAITAEISAALTTEELNGIMEKHAEALQSIDVEDAELARDIDDKLRDKRNILKGGA